MNADPRRRELARIHCLRKELAIDEDSYRDMLFTLTRKESSALLDMQERRTVIAHMQAHVHARKGRVAQPAAPRLALERADKAPEDRRALMLEIARLLGVIGKEAPYADGIARNMFGVERYEWCKPDQLHKLVAALNYARMRLQRKARSA